jgi:octanoyl-[GcvH]:protein N-octanoyltransferase
VLDEIMAAKESLTGIQNRFARGAERQPQALRGLGIDARVGKAPGQYCPGAFTVNAGGHKKLIGAVQRAVRGGWLLSTVVLGDCHALQGYGEMTGAPPETDAEVTITVERG